MKRVIVGVLAVLVAAGGAWATDVTAEDLKPGLVGHYFKDPDNWNGGWPDHSSVPLVNPADWTFREYRYSRVEPLINHEFVKKGWFSIRWTGYFDPAGNETSDGQAHAVGGGVNLNPANGEALEFAVLLPDGTTITQDRFGEPGFTGYAGPASAVRLKPKGNANANGLTVDGAAYALLNARAYDILSGAMTVQLTNDKLENGHPKGQWWLGVEATEATILCREEKAGKDKEDSEQEYVFEMLADDGCRLILDGKVLIDSWTACAEDSPEAWRRAAPVMLKGGAHRIVVEYFQGQSLKHDDRDPIRVYWTCKERGIDRAVVPPVHFGHGPADVSGFGR